MSIDEGVTHRGDSPTPDGEVSRPRRAAVAAPEEAATPAAARRPETKDAVAKRRLPPVQVLVAAGLVLVAVELLLWQVGGPVVALLAHVIVAVAAVVFAFLVWAMRRSKDRRGGRPGSAGRGGGGAAVGAGPGAGLGRGAGALARLRGLGRGGSGPGGAAGGRPGTSTGARSGAAGGGRGQSRLGGLLSRMTGRPRSGSTGAAGRAGTAHPGSTPGRSGAAPKAAGMLGRLGAAMKRSTGSRSAAGGSGRTGGGSGRVATARPGAAPSGAGASGGAVRRGPLSWAKGLRGPRATGSTAGRSAGSGGKSGRTGTPQGRGATGRGRAFIDNLRHGGKNVGAAAADGAPGKSTPSKAGASASTGDAQRRTLRDRIFGKSPSDHGDTPKSTDRQPDAAASAKPSEQKKSEPVTPANAGDERQPRHKRNPDQQPVQKLIKQEVDAAARTVSQRSAPQVHQPRHSRKGHQPQHTGGNAMPDASRIRSAAEELQAALKQYDPGAMRQLLRDFPAIGEALTGVGAGVKSIADRAESDWPAAGPVVEALQSMARDITAAGGTAEVHDVMMRSHETDIERHDAPRGGSKATEARWDVTTDEG